ncbi:hypothetical protein [Rhodococcus sp. B10]|uniref:hypothetical protein n=1 Tax=Rhodococcus sp. B10 TaxID=2695876 RepID=UPI001430ECC2|nr:hypothetical protein [Rhodococcus sp. B10]NIL77146.1 hypothetical protein [Rhodococcus sp. B10]
MNYQPLNKRQVGALLKVISADTARPVLTELAIATDKSGQAVLVATDGYVMAILPAAELSDVKGKTITRDALTRWYKLAATRDTLKVDSLRDMVGEPAGVYPNWEQQIDNMHEAAVTQLLVNPDYLKFMEQLAGDLGRSKTLSYTFHGVYGALVAEHNGARYVVMPLKPGK